FRGERLTAASVAGAVLIAGALALYYLRLSFPGGRRSSLSWMPADRAGRTHRERPMPSYLALTYTADVDWSEPEQAAELAEYREFMAAAGAVVKGGKALYPTATATTVRVAGGKGGDVLTTDGPYAETKEALTGYYVLECADLDEAVRV